MASRIGQPEGLVERGVDEEVGRLIEAGRLLEWHAADEDNVVGRCPSSSTSRVQFGGVLLVTLGADDDKLAALQFGGARVSRPGAGRRSSCTARGRTRTARTVL